jgi:acetylornithine deacetylase
MDTVPAGDGWNSDPFHMIESDGACVGRGAADMKGFVALAINVLAGLDPQALRAPLVLLLTRDEEVGTLGARDLVERWPPDQLLPRATVVGEPTDLEVVRAHKGHVELRLFIDGEAAHSAYPHLGENAIELAGRAVGALAELRQQLRRRRPESAELFPEAPFVTLNVGTIAGGTAVNVVPDRCLIDFDLRPLPGMDNAEVRAEAMEHLAIALPESSYRIETTGETPPLLTSEESELYEVLMQITGQQGRPDRGMSYTTDAGWLAALGLDCVLFGPGEVAVLHKPDERVSVAQLARTRDLLEQLVTRFCR